MIALNAAMMTDGAHDRGGRRHAIGAAAAYRPCRHQPNAGGDVHALAAAPRQGIQPHTLIESFIAANNAATPIRSITPVMMLVGAEARLDHVRLAEDSRDAFNVSSPRS